MSTRRARHRQRAEAVDQPLLQVLGEPERGHEAAERHRLDDDPGHQEVDVVVARRLDRAAEDVDEEQHEHDRLDGEADQQVGLARDAQEAALREHERVGDGVARCRHAAPARLRRPGLLGSAAWPVSVRKTSSSVGRRSAMSSMPIPASSRRRTASAITPRRSAQRHAQRAVLDERRRRPRSARALRSAARRARVVEADLEPVAADLRLELVGRALGDHAGPGR